MFTKFLSILGVLLGATIAQSLVGSSGTLTCIGEIAINPNGQEPPFTISDGASVIVTNPDGGDELWITGNNIPAGIVAQQAINTSFVYNLRKHTFIWPLESKKWKKVSNPFLGVGFVPAMATDGKFIHLFQGTSVGTNTFPFISFDLGNNLLSYNRSRQLHSTNIPIPCRSATQSRGLFYDLRRIFNRSCFREGALLFYGKTVLITFDL